MVRAVGAWTASAGAGLARPFPGGAGAAIGNKVRLSSTGNRPVICLLQGLVTQSTVLDRYQLCTKHLVKQQVGRGLIGHFAVQHEDAIQSKACRGGCRLAAMV